MGSIENFICYNGSSGSSKSNTATMRVLSVKYSQSSVCLSLPLSSCPKIYGGSSPPIISIPVSTLKSSWFPLKLSINGKSNRIRANSADPERDLQYPTQSSQDNDGIPEDSGNNQSTSFLSVLCPLLKLFSGGDPSQERNYIFEVGTSSLSTLARLPWGSRSLTDSLDSKEISAVDPPHRLQLFEFEACPFCRRVREAITELDLSVEIYPCPKGSMRHREMVRSMGGKEQFPFLVDPNTGISIYESSEIVKYLFQQYGKGRSPTFGLLESTLFTGWMPTILRAGRGMSLWEKARTELPPKKLELFAYENNPYARIVREALCELELPYILQTVGKGSQRMNLLLDASGSEEVPYIIDPNTGTRIGDYKKILSYLFETYSAVSV